jgi:ABC-type multidrug transport system fused ATPase/permease subunit
MCSFITKFSSDTTISIVSCQAVMVILTVFAGGLFIPWNKCPSYWKWLQELSIFTQASRSALMNIDDYIEYKCYVNSLGQCFSPTGDYFPCDARPPVDGICYVSGRMVLHVTQGTIIGESKWVPFGYLVLILVCFRFACLLLMFYPVKKIMSGLTDFFCGISSKGILDGKIRTRKVECQLNTFITNHNVMDEEKRSLLAKDEFIHPNTLIHQHSKKMTDILDEMEDDQLLNLFQFNNPNAKNQYCLEWKNLSVNLKKNNKVLINNVSGVALPGRILALMGPSGILLSLFIDSLIPWSHIF